MFTFADEVYRKLVVRCLLQHVSDPCRCWNPERCEPSSYAVEAAASPAADPAGNGDVQWLRFVMSLWDDTPRAVDLGRLDPPRLRCLGKLLRAVAAGDQAVELWILAELGMTEFEFTCETT